MSDAIVIALAEAQRLNVVAENHPVRLSVEDAQSARVRWRRRLENDQGLGRQLRGKAYWAIYIAPNPPPGTAVIGGTSIVVFVDTASRTVLGYLRPGESD